jgi:NRAMP (natural resistance-associated macrophage protein)-like metal ion transporter
MWDGARLRWSRLVLFLSVMGPGIITGNVDNDANGIATYSIAGATYGYKILWTLVLSTLSLAVVQEMGARLGAVTGKGLAALIRERFRVRLTLLAMAVLVLANWANTAGDFAGVAGALEIFGISRYITIPLTVFLVIAFLLWGSYRSVERVFLIACLLYVTYVISAVLAKPPWGEVIKASLTPSFEFDAPFITMIIGVVGTTIAPWMQFYQQSAVVDKGIRVEELSYTRIDTYLGALSTNVVAFFIVVACAATLFIHRVSINNAQDAAVALAPLAGKYASLLFALGLLNGALFSVAIIPLSTAYAVCEAFGWEAGMNRNFREAPVFVGLYVALIVTAALVILFPGIPLVPVMFLSQVLNGILLPVVLVFMLLLINDERIVGPYRNSTILNAVAWITVIAMIILSLLLVVTTAMGLAIS